MDLANRSGSGLHVMRAFEFIPPREYMSVALRLHSLRSFPRQGQRLLDEQVGRVEEAGGPSPERGSRWARRSTRSSTPARR
jgi:hypothetical protein